MLNLPTLYKKTKTGAIQQWHIEVYALPVFGEIVTNYGQVDGQIQQNRETIFEGKNIGRANQTTALQQAEAEATSRWDKKVKSGYVKDIEQASAGQDDIGGILPMLAHSFDDHAKKIVFPCLVQSKLDGNRCIAIVEGGIAKLFSRTRKPINSMPHIVTELQAAFPNGRYVFDGELYSHSLKEDFEEIQSLVRQKGADQNHQAIQYHIYDMVVENISNELRQAGLAEIFRYHALDHCQLVPTYIVHDRIELARFHDQFVAEGYEGAMVRNLEGLYSHTRSYDLQKVKLMKDEEFYIADIKEGRGKLAGHGIFVCHNNNGTITTFDAKMSGPVERLKSFWENPQRFIGKQLTVQFQGRYRKTTVPRFPVALRIREPE